ncbi:hypothetical protein RvY_13057 [Ramazzottius varieornatus]|uniref:Uncharacterized protein n=1 Tax=Ramazzottius varieornatus TaxID=947166 RepID=A0A1D1VRY9_RAMVA|nr:hypothetical protein RvY_13057 [Ramazzottius varieornatus]
MSMIAKFVGPRYMELAKAWTPSLMAFGAAGGLLGLYLTDWKVITQYIPLYGGKYKETRDI